MFRKKNEMHEASPTAAERRVAPLFAKKNEMHEASPAAAAPLFAKKNEMHEASLATAAPSSVEKNEMHEASSVASPTLNEMHEAGVGQESASCISFFFPNEGVTRPAEIDCRSRFAGDDETDSLPLAAGGDGWVRSLFQ